MTARRQQLAITLTCLVAAVSYAGAVTTHALALYVLPGVAGAALFASLLVAHRMDAAALIVGGVLVLGWSELVNIWSGTGEGPAARSTFFAAGWTIIAIVAAHSRWPAVFLGGVAGVVAGAVVLGAGGEVRIVAVATAVCAALTLGWLERTRRNWTAPPRRGLAPVVLSLLAAAVAVGVVLWQAQKDPRRPVLATQGREYPWIKPSWTDPIASASKALGGPSHRSNGTAQRNSASSPPPANRPQTHANNPPPRSKNPPSRTHHRPPTHTHEHGPSPSTRPHHTPTQTHAPQSSLWLYVLVGILLGVLALGLLVGARLLATRLAWRRVRQRLAAGAPADQITGSWAWMRMRLEACRLPLAVAVSPDLLTAGQGEGGFPAQVFAPLQAVATATTAAAFANEQSLGAGEATAAWAAAGQAEASARELLTRSGRARLAFRRPASTALLEDEAAPRRLTTAKAAIIAASGLVLCFAILAGFGVFSSGKRAAPPVSTPTKRATAPVSRPTVTVTAPTVTAPTTRHHRRISTVKAPSQTLAAGDTGSQVKILQRALAALGFSAGKPDGSYGPATQTAVERFQASKGLPQVGIFGPLTLAALQHALSRRSRR